MSRGKLIAVVVGGALVAIAAGPQGPLGGFWGAEPVEGMGGAVFGALMLYALLEAIGFGAGVAWIAFGRRLPHIPRSSYLAIGWMLVSWFPHGAFHQSTSHTNWAGLAAIEYAFHLTMIVAAAVVATDLIRSSQAQPIMA